jgi:hypothetical protein
MINSAQRLHRTPLGHLNQIGPSGEDFCTTPDNNGTNRVVKLDARQSRHNVFTQSGIESVELLRSMQFDYEYIALACHFDAFACPFFWRQMLLPIHRFSFKRPQEAPLHPYRPQCTSRPLRT